MMSIHRRLILAAGATLASALAARKLLADTTLLRVADPTPMPQGLRFNLPDGTVRTLADYAGKGVVLNLWATWCVPCVAEMPALDNLAQATAAANIAVLPLSSDRGGAIAVDRFYRERKVNHLPILLDPGGAAARLLGVKGIPTTLLIDRQGQERGRLEGGADWDSPATIAMIKKLATA